jgi:hypothetical protein
LNHQEEIDTFIATGRFMCKGVWTNPNCACNAIKSFTLNMQVAGSGIDISIDIN